MELISTIGTIVVVEPLLNLLIVFYNLLFDNIALSIIAITILIRLATYPLTVRQVRMTRAQSDIAPKLRVINERFKGDPQRRSQETMRLYRESGISPVGCIGPMVIQFPIWIGLYWAIIKGIGDTPGAMIYLSQHLYGWIPGILDTLPINVFVLGIDLTERPGDSGVAALGIVIPFLVGASMFVVQKMTMQNNAGNPQAQSTSTMMLYMFPIFFGWLTVQFPTGLALYWLISNVVTIGMQYFIIGWGGLRPSRNTSEEVNRSAHEEGTDDREGTTGNNSQNSGRSDSNRPKRTRRRSGRGRGRRPRSR
ncbi:MAG: membrane protein insertase YidC [SAR202 cluster bacterium]|nr:membrane protein insertase YidC [SAR202 cluster bacterium]|tara:strand:+ start:4418 stop:5341 length:924 start_codon:yes stop_codon:yes gene_type:complete